MWHTYLTVAIVAYLLGSIPFGYILVKLFLKQDIRTTGSGNIGATNVARSGKKGLAIATLLLDAGKGYFGVVLSLALIRKFGDVDYSSIIPSGLFYLPIEHWTKGYWLLQLDRQAASPSLFGHDLYWLATVAALASILGHCFPVWLRFKGGKGVATALGAFLFVCPKAVLFSAVIFFISFVLTKFVSASSILSALLFPAFAALLNPRLHYTPALLTMAASSGVIILKHHSNIRRLLNGTEPKFGVKKPAPDPIQVEKNA